MNFIIQVLIAVAVLFALIVGIGFLTNRTPEQVVKDSTEDLKSL